jgi:hypothetical protein
MSKNNVIRTIVIVFLLLAFFAGAYVYSAIDLKKMISKLEGMEDKDEEDKNKKPKADECPDTLVQSGKLLYLFNTKKEEKAGINPIVFNNLDEYGEYLAKQRQSGKSCPILFLQQETNTQGEDVFRIRPSPFSQQERALPMTSALFVPVNPDNAKTLKALDASRENGYNKNMYAGFDPYGLYVGKVTDIDKIHESTANDKVSDNPMDPNWGGVLYTQSTVDNGKYVGNEVTRITYPNAKANM